MIVKNKAEKTIRLSNLAYSKAEEDVDINFTPVGIAYSKKDAGVNAGGLFGGVHGNAGVNFGGLGGIVDGDVGFNAGGLFGGVHGNAGVNFGGLLGGVHGDARVNASLGYSSVGNSSDYTIGDVLPKVTKYLPKFIREIALPALNLGSNTDTQAQNSSFILGFFNNIKESGGDYISLGLINRVKNLEGKISWRPFFSGKISIDGIFRHKKQNYRGEEQK